MRNQETKVRITCDVCGKEEILNETVKPGTEKIRSITQPILQMDATINKVSITAKLMFSADSVEDICKECSTEIIKAFVSQIQKSV